MNYASIKETDVELSEIDALPAWHWSERVKEGKHTQNYVRSIKKFLSKEKPIFVFHKLGGKRYSKDGPLNVEATVKLRGYRTGGLATPYGFYREAVVVQWAAFGGHLTQNMVKFLKSLANHPEFTASGDECLIKAIGRVN